MVTKNLGRKAEETLAGIKLSKEDKEVISIGLKSIFDKKALNPIVKLREQTKAVCLRYGTKFMGGYLVPENRAQWVSDELEKIRIEFYASVNVFLSEYPTLVDQWVEKYPALESIIRAKAPHVNYVKTRFEYHVTLFRVERPSDESLSKGLEKTTGRLSQSVFSDVADTATKILNGMLDKKTGKGTATQSNVNNIVAIRDKIDGLSFLDKSFKPLVTYINGIVSTLPQKGSFDGENYTKVFTFLSAIKDEDAIKNLATGLLAEQEKNKPVSIADMPSEPKIEEIKAPKGDTWFDDILDSLSEDSDESSTKKASGLRPFAF